jgi:hypothetical protein
MVKKRNCKKAILKDCFPYCKLHGGSLCSGCPFQHIRLVDKSGFLNRNAGAKGKKTAGDAGCLVLMHATA